MAFYFLVNTFGNAAASAEVGATAGGTAKADLVSGPRSTLVCSPAGASNTFGYESDADVAVTHVVLARADKLLTRNTSRVYLKERDSSGSWHATYAFDRSPLAAADLVGVTSQDYVAAVSQTYPRGVAVTAATLSGSEAMCLSKLYASYALSIGDPLPGRVTHQPLPEDTRATALDGHIPYEVEAEIGLTFQCGAADVAALEALPQVLNWPLFLYDAAGYVWDHKLEHVILTGFRHTNEDAFYDQHVLELTFNRLKHYD